MKKDVYASKLIRIAKSLVAYDGDAKLVEIESKLQDLHQQFETALSARVKIYNDAVATFQAAEKEMKDAYAAFKKETGWDKAMKSCEEEIAAYEKAGGDVSKISSKFKVASTKSKQPSYKEWLDLVASTFNNAEFKKYMDLLDAFKKNSITLSNGLKMADIAFKDWDEKTKELYVERGLDLPKASVRTAGFKDVIKNIGQFIGKIFSKLGNILSGLLKGCTKSANDMKSESQKIAKLLN